MAKPGIRSILVNILGGVTRCDMVAQGIAAALKETKNKVSIVVRMIGTNEVEGARILQQAGINVSSDMEEAVREAIALQGQS
jgi:succinyl-CoA synthetase beta subunit